MSEANEDKTSGDFREMGLRLAQEVISFLKKKMDRASRHGVLGDIKLSFVGHSIGNIIIRTALTESIMEPFLRYLYTYVSISGPHLGYLYSSNSLFNSGMWLLKKLKGTQCIHQLTFTDNPDLRNTFFYKLSEDSREFQAYNSVIFTTGSFMGLLKKGKIFLEMLNDCLDQIRAPSSEQRVFLRCDINFDTSSYGKSLNTFIGRAAHIDFLESDIFASFPTSKGVLENESGIEAISLQMRVRKCMLRWATVNYSLEADFSGRKGWKLYMVLKLISR
ncbi:hypothetical protein FNV43_RR12616 [Rhamnella rubrinervis]|nr:hypothetical protein FNV43_RR12616 [Rhamnella rubrinervis]